MSETKPRFMRQTELVLLPSGCRSKFPVPAVHEPPSKRVSKGVITPSSDANGPASAQNSGKTWSSVKLADGELHYGQRSCVTPSSVMTNPIKVFGGHDRQR